VGPEILTKSSAMLCSYGERLASVWIGISGSGKRRRVIERKNSMRKLGKLNEIGRDAA